MINYLISREEILKGELCPPELEENLSKLLEALNTFRASWGRPMIVTSGYRDREHNKRVGGRENSAHLFCMAADFADPEKDLARFCLGNEEWLAHCGLWVEDPHYCKNWLHFQIRPASKRIFRP